MVSIGRRGKIQGKVVSHNPLVILVSKNGRSVREENAKAFLRKHFPLVFTWEFRYTDHSLEATAKEREVK